MASLFCWEINENRTLELIVKRKNWCGIDEKLKMKSQKNPPPIIRATI